MDPTVREPSHDSQDRAALEALIVDDPDFQELERRIAPFNIFEAVGVVRQEERHSDFLAFLLDPSQNHGLSDTFLKRFLQRALKHYDYLGSSARSWTFSRLSRQR